MPSLGSSRWQMAAGCAMLPSSLSPLSSPLPSLSTSPTAPTPVLSARVFHALAGFCSQEGDCLVSEHHHNQAWRRRRPLQHPWKKRNTTAPQEEREPFAASLQVTTFAKAWSPPHCTQDLFRPFRENNLLSKWQGVSLTECSYPQRE